jgi:uncharacterized protein YbaP (TraB family)
MSRWILIVSFYLLLTPLSYAENDKAFFWQVESESATVYLLGSIHYADPGFYPLRPAIEKAFEASDKLVVEIAIDEAMAKTYQDLINEQGTYPGKETIEQHVSAETYQSLLHHLELLGLPLEYVNRHKPGIIVLTLTSVQLLKMGFMPEMGIDLYFLKRARQNKDIIELETIEQQIDIFLSIPDGDLLLRETLHSLEQADILMADIVRSWKLGDMALLEKILFEDTLSQYPSYEDIYDRLFYERNENMSQRIRELLQEKGSYFVVIGAGHFVGEKGILRLLEDSGYDVKRL